MEKRCFYGIEIVGEKGFYIAPMSHGDSGHSSGSTANLLYDGVLSEPSFHLGWRKLPKQPKIIERIVQQPSTNPRFELIDVSLVSEKIPLMFLPEEVLTDSAVNNRNYYCDWVNHTMLQNLYTFKSDPQEPIKEMIDFEFVEIFKVNKILEPQKFDFDVLRDPRYKSEGTKKVSPSDVNYKTIERIVYPDILLNQRPCEFDSVTMYNIVRQHISENIDPKVAKISSDYPFCFAVEKRIPLVEPI